MGLNYSCLFPTDGYFLIVIKSKYIVVTGLDTPSVANVLPGAAYLFPAQKDNSIETPGSGFGMWLPKLHRPHTHTVHTHTNLDIQYSYNTLHLFKMVIKLVYLIRINMGWVCYPCVAKNSPLQQHTHRLLQVFMHRASWPGCQIRH